MKESSAKRSIRQLLDLAGVQINGPAPADITVHDERLYRRVLAHGSLGLGESYMDGWWDAPALDQLMFKILSAELKTKIPINFQIILGVIQDRLINYQTKARAFKVGEQHYDLGNDLYQAMLDQRLVYTCGYWGQPTDPIGQAKNLDEAQERKLDLVCRKLGLKPGQKILDIGCGWGSFLKFAAERYGVSGVGITVSKEQVELARKLCQGRPIEIRLQDYRDVKEKFDHIVSLGMFEHVGVRNYRTYMKVVADCLADDGLFLLHTIGSNESVYNTDPWIEKYIFPNSMLPSVAQISVATEKLFVLEDWHNFGPDYDLTLMAWHDNFEQAWPTLKAHYDERFHRMWRYYLLSCAALFRARQAQLWQIVFSKTGVPGGYQSVR